MQQLQKMQQDPPSARVPPSRLCLHLANTDCSPSPLFSYFSLGKFLLEGKREHGCFGKDGFVGWVPCPNSQCHVERPGWGNISLDTAGASFAAYFQGIMQLYHRGKQEPSHAGWRALHQL